MPAPCRPASTCPHLPPCQLHTRLQPQEDSRGQLLRSGVPTAQHALGAPPAPRTPAFPSHHGSPFSAIGALLAASLQRAERGKASYAHVDVLLPGNNSTAPPTRGADAEAAGMPAGAAEGTGGGAALPAEASAAPQPQPQPQQRHPLLLIEDDAAGLSPLALRRSIGMPPRTNAAHSVVAATPAAPAARAGAIPAGAAVSPSSASSPNSSASSFSSALKPDLVHAALRLGSTVLVLSKRREQGATVGLLHCTPAPVGKGAAWLEAVALDFAADGSRHLAASSSQVSAPDAAATAAEAAAAPTAAVTSATAVATSAGSSAWQAALDAIHRRWPGGASEAQLRQQLADMPQQGTRVLVARLHTWLSSSGDSSAGPEAAGTAAGEVAFELDWQTDPADLRAAGSSAAAAAGSQRSCEGLGPASSLPQPTRLPPPQQQQQQQSFQQHQQQAEPPDPGIQRCMALQHSLRAYMSLLFLRWPGGFRLRLRGTDVAHQQLKEWMKCGTVEEYRPRGIRDEVDEHGFHMQHVVNVHLGFLREAPLTAMQGVCMYQQNRLVKPFWRVCSSSGSRGVVGYLEVDFLEPTPDWQDFQRTHVLAKLEAFLKRAVPGYFKRHLHLLAGPPAAPEHMPLLPRPRPLAMPPPAQPLGPWQAPRPPAVVAGRLAGGLGQPLGGGPAGVAAAAAAARVQAHNPRPVLLPQHAVAGAFLPRPRAEHPVGSAMDQLAAAATVASLAARPGFRPMGPHLQHRPPPLPPAPAPAPLQSPSSTAQPQQRSAVQALLAQLSAPLALGLPPQQLSLALQQQLGQAGAPDLAVLLRMAQPQAQPAASSSAALAAAVQQAQQQLSLLQQQLQTAQQQEQQQNLLRLFLPLLAAPQPQPQPHPATVGAIPISANPHMQQLQQLLQQLPGLWQPQQPQPQLQQAPPMQVQGQQQALQVLLSVAQPAPMAGLGSAGQQDPAAALLSCLLAGVGASPPMRQGCQLPALPPEQQQAQQQRRAQQQQQAKQQQQQQQAKQQQQQAQQQAQQQQQQQQAQQQQQQHMLQQLAALQQLGRESSETGSAAGAGRLLGAHRAEVAQPMASTAGKPQPAAQQEQQEQEQLPADSHQSARGAGRRTRPASCSQAGVEAGSPAASSGSGASKRARLA